MTKTVQEVNTELLLKEIVNLIIEKKGNNVLSIKFTPEISNICDYFIITDTNSSRHAKAIFEYIIEKIKEKYNIKPYYTQGADNAEWIIIDYIDIVVHIFIKEKRDFYDLEGLWADAQFTNYSKNIDANGK